MRVVKLAFVVALAWTVCLTSMALASTPGGPVGQVAAAYTPSIHWTGTTQQVRKMVQCGANIYAVGSFTQIDQGGVTTHAQRGVQLLRHDRETHRVEPQRQRHRERRRLDRGLLHRLPRRLLHDGRPVGGR